MTSECRMELRMSREVAENARDQHNLLSFSETAAEISSFFLLSYPPCVVETAKEEAEDKEKGEEEGGVWVIEVVPDFGAEEYEVAVHETKIHVKAASPVGALWAWQSLRQLLPVEVEHSMADLIRDGKVLVPACVIRDAPKFEWRGSMLDCARHFMPVELIERHIELLSLLKINVLHLHLTEDQAWRIAVDAFPLLHNSAWRPGPGGGVEGGLYSKEELRGLVQLGRRRGVTVVPEIELPGHCTAALAAYPHLSCSEVQLKVEARWGVYEDVYCLGKDSTLQFLETVLGEVLDIFPSKHIHIGGDEVPFTRWRSCQHCQGRIRAEGLPNEAALQSWAVHRIAAFLQSHGRVLVGWDEILQGSLPSDVVVQAWRGPAGAVAAAKQGLRVVSSPTEHCYLDYDVAVTDLRRAYEFRPVPPEMPPALHPLVLGGEFNMWTEYAPAAVVETKLWPRGLALAEVLWSGPGGDFETFYQHVKAYQLPRLTALGIQAGPAFPPGWTELGNPPQAADIVLSVPHSEVTSSVPHYKHHHKEFACDGHPDTFFWTNRSLLAGDFIALHFSTPLCDCTLIQVKTGRFDRDFMRSGVVEVKLQGQAEYEVRGQLVHGCAGVPIGAGVPVEGVRVRCTQEQSEWCILKTLAVETTSQRVSEYRGPMLLLHDSPLPVEGHAWASFSTYLMHHVSHVVDGCADTVCWSDRCVVAGDNVTLLLADPAPSVATVRAVTGTAGAEGGAGDMLQQGVLQVSGDGEEWHTVCAFSHGQAEGPVPDSISLKGVRVRVTGAQDQWLKVRSIQLVPKPARA